MTWISIRAVMATAIAGALTVGAPASAKTAKECRAEWTANKAAYQAKGVTEKAYIAQCRAAVGKPAAANSEKPKATAKEKVSTKAAAPENKKTVRECRAEWHASKAANQAKSITEKAYVEYCRNGKPASARSAVAPTTKSEPVQTPTESERFAPPAEKPQPVSPISAPSGVNQFADESQAKARCPEGLVVWANLNSKIYHFAGRRDYGHTKDGAYMCETDAEAQGMRAAKNEKHP